MMAGLTRKKITVKRKGKTFQRSMMVKSAEVTKGRPVSGKIDPEHVSLGKIKGGPGKGGGPGGEAWKIYAHKKMAGKAWINHIDEPPVGPHASLSVFLNKQSQGQGIGRIAFSKACQQSRYNTIYGHIAKSNTASRRAAAAAGFIDVTPPGYRQVLVRWDRPKH